MKILFWFSLLVAVQLPLTTTSSAMQQSQSSVCFPEAAPVIQQCIEGRFAEFWVQNGGLAVFGYPVSAAEPERNSDTGQTYVTQYFERQRFEFHPEQTRPYDVQLGRLGDDYLRRSGRDWHTLPRAAPGTPHLQHETGHAIASEFYAYYRAHGLDLNEPGLSEHENIALFGYAISEPMIEQQNGQTVLVQYFERARLEYHPENAVMYRVLQGRLGSDAHNAVDHHESPHTSPDVNHDPDPETDHDSDRHHDH